MKNALLQTQSPAEQVLPEIVDRLKRLDPEKIILFGSQAQGNADEWSDLDLIVVTQHDQIPATYREKEEIYLEVSKLLRDIRREIPIDLIVHTRPMHDRFIALDSLFAREVQEKGIVLYEKHHQ